MSRKYIQSFQGAFSFVGNRGSAAPVLFAVILSIALIYTMFSFLQASSQRLSFRRGTHKTFEATHLGSRELTILLIEPATCRGLLENKPYSDGMEPLLVLIDDDSGPSFLRRRRVESWSMSYMEPHRAEMIFKIEQQARPLRVTTHLVVDSGVIQNCSSDAAKIVVVP